MRRLMSGPVVIVGGGITGVSIAYHLAQRGVPATIVDAVGIAPAASGKAGGFLALDWSDGGVTGPLTRKSFAMHAELAAKLPVPVDYRRLTCEAIGVTANGVQRKVASAEFADRGVLGSQPMGTEATIAQVHPKKLTEALWAEAQRAGSTLVVGEVEGVEVSGNVEAGKAHVSAARLAGGRVQPAATVVLAMGPWSPKWLGLPPAHGIKYHSVVLQSRRVLSQAVFFDGLGDPEVYPRPDSSVYVTGFPDPPAPVTERPGAEAVRPDVAESLKKVIGQVSSELENAPVMAEQACYLPCTSDNVPIMGRIPGVQGGYVATGASCWGILMAPATGLGMAELILDGQATSVDMTPFDPASAKAPALQSIIMMQDPACEEPALRYFHFDPAGTPRKKMALALGARSLAIGTRSQAGTGKSSLADDLVECMSSPSTSAASSFKAAASAKLRSKAAKNYAKLYSRHMHEGVSNRAADLRAQGDEPDIDALWADEFLLLNAMFENEDVDHLILTNILRTLECSSRSLDDE